MDRQQDVIRRITAHVVAYRFHLENERHESRKNMAIEIKGLKADALTARANLDKLRAAYAKFNEAAPAHAADVEGLATTIGGMQSDLEFAATVMGNSDGASGVSQKPPVVLKVAPDVTDRVALGPHPDQPEGQQTASQAPGSASASADPQPNGADVLVRAAE
jgi:hypothetical protein